MLQLLLLLPDISQRALTKKSVFHLLRSNLQAKDSLTSTRTVFLLLTICAANGKSLKCQECNNTFQDFEFFTFSRYHKMK